MASTQDLKRRVRSITNTRKVTKAMELVASARLRRSQMRIDRVAAGRGLHVTLDGIHLNSTGAQLVADAFMRALDDRMPHKAQQA